MSCFICEVDDGRILYKMCKCSTFAHRECMEDVIRRVRSHHTSCPVCCTTYDVASHHVSDCRLSGRFAREIIVSYTAMVLLWIATAIVYSCETHQCSQGPHLSMCPILIVLGTLSGMSCLLSLMFHMSNARICCLERVRRLVHVSLNVPTVQQL